MAVGQQVLAPVFDVGAASAVEGRLALVEVDRSALHARSLRDLLELRRVYEAAGQGLSVPAQAALLLRASEHRATDLLGAAGLLAGLPGALEAVECGLLTVEQTTAVVTLLLPLPVGVRLAVWARLQARLVDDEMLGVQRTPARLRDWLARQIATADPDGTGERRRAAASAGDVDYRRRDDGLVDLWASGLSGPDGHAVLTRIRAQAEPFGAHDARPAGVRRVQALVDLVLGRCPRPSAFDDQPDASAPAPRPAHGSACGCLPGSPVPCGAELSVLVPIGAALGTTDEVAELVGHGPLEPDLLHDLLLSAPRLRAVRVDEAGVPVGVSDRVHTPDRGDPTSVRRALGRLLAEPPGPPQPRHPDDHAAPDDLRDPRAGCDGPAGGDPPARGPQITPPRLLTRAHPAGTPGSYRPSRRLRRLLQVRSPRCEWPGCGARSARCDQDHDLAWPHGPTCACQMGSLCRRHHRVKQTGWTKWRTASGVRWTSPTGRTWNSPAQHEPPASRVRPWAAVPPPVDELDRLGPAARDDELRHLVPGDTGWDDDEGLELRVEDTDPDARSDQGLDHLLERILHGDTRWGLDLDDPWPWTAEPWTAEPWTAEPAVPFAGDR